MRQKKYDEGGGHGLLAVKDSSPVGSGCLLTLASWIVKLAVLAGIVWFVVRLIGG